MCLARESFGLNNARPLGVKKFSDVYLGEFFLKGIWIESASEPHLYALKVESRKPAAPAKNSREKLLPLASRSARNSATRAALLPQLFPIPNSMIHQIRQLISHLPRQHTNLPPMVRLMRNHVAQHLRTNRPGLRPSVATKFRNASAVIAKRFRQHLRAPRRTLRQPRTRLSHGAPRTVQLTWHPQMRRRKPHPLAPHVVYMRKNRHDATAPADRFRPPSSGL